MLMRTFIAFIAIFVAGAVMAQAYRWVDEDGVVHFSDTPVEGAERIDVSESSRTTGARVFTPAPRAAEEQQSVAEEAAEETPAVFQYESIEVVAPAPEETLWNIEGVLNVAIRVTPALRPEDRVRVYFDGNERMVTGSNFQIEEVYRGVHNIQVEVIDSTGRLMGRSLTNRFYVQQNSIASN